MSLTWALIAGFLYIEIAIVLLLVLPIFSASRWNRFFKSRFLAVIARQAQIYFYLTLGVLVIFVLEAIREMRKYSAMEEETTLNLGMQHSMRLFRAQRNFYISGFAIFLSLVIRRLIILISTQATLLANAEASMKQAQSATTAARTLMKDQKPAAADGSDDDEKKALKEQVKLLKDELNREQKDKEAMKSQAESLNREYDRLTAEYSKLQNKVERAGDKSN